MNLPAVFCHWLEHLPVSLVAMAQEGLTRKLCGETVEAEKGRVHGQCTSAERMIRRNVGSGPELHKWAEEDAFGFSSRTCILVLRPTRDGLRGNVGLANWPCCRCATFTHASPCGLRGRALIRFGCSVEAAARCTHGCKSGDL